MRSQERMRERSFTDSSGHERPRHIATIAAKSNAAGAVSVAIAAAFDTGLPAGTYSATGLPTGLTIHATTGVVSGTAVAGSYPTARVTVRNGLGVAQSNTFAWTITA